MRDITFADIKSYVREQLHQFARVGADGRSTAARDWRILLIIFVLLTTLFIAASFFLYTEIERGDIFITDPQDVAPETLFDNDQLNNVLLQFAEKSSHFEALHDSPPSIANP